MENETKSLNSDLVYSIQSALDDGKIHIPYSEEMSFYDLVKQGNLQELEKRNPQLLTEGQGVLSDDVMRNTRYHFIIATAFITRFCIEGGLDKEEAYTLSDVYIRKMDRLDKMEDIKKLHHDMVFDYALKMRNLKKSSGDSLYVRKAIDYVSNHLNGPIYVEDIAKNLNISEKYLSSLFKKETGETLIAYIERRHMETACWMLCYTDYTYNEIAANLSYCSQSYFTKIFKKHYNLTPMQYRMKFAEQKFLK